MDHRVEVCVGKKETFTKCTNHTVEIEGTLEKE